MHYTQAYNELEASGQMVGVSMRNDAPVELLVWDKTLDNWTHYANIDDDENVVIENHNDTNRTDQTMTLLTAIRQSAHSIVRCYPNRSNVALAALQSRILSARYKCNDIAIARAIRHYAERYAR